MNGNRCQQSKLQFCSVSSSHQVVPGFQAPGHIHPEVVWLGQVGEVVQVVSLEDADYPIRAATEDEFLADTEAGR